MIEKITRHIPLLILVLSLLVGLVFLLPGGSVAGASAIITRFSFIRDIHRCRITGKEKIDKVVVRFKKSHIIQNPNYFPKHTGVGQKLNWQLGKLVSRKRKQVETRASLFTPEGVSVLSPLVAVSVGTYFKSSVTAVGKGKVCYTLRVLDESGKKLAQTNFQITSRQGWSPFRVSLTRFSGKKIKIALSAHSSKDAFPFWGEPAVYGSGSRCGPNVLIIMVDAMRYDVLGVNGSSLGITPNIDRYAARGVSFTNCYANANWTRPSELSMFTGKYPRRLRINQLDFPLSSVERDFFYKNIKTLPDLFRKRGYRTRGIINNIFLQAFTGTGVDIGFSHMSDFRTLNRDTRDISKEALRWAKQHRGQSWFMFCNFNTPHKPYSAPRRFFNQVMPDRHWRFGTKVKEYLAEVAFADYWIGILLDGLERSGLLKNTIVVINADHGEVLWPWHNYSTVYSEYTRFGHSLTMLDEELKIPLVIFGPGVQRKGCDGTLVQLVDLFPTLAALSGFDALSGLDGRDLSPLLRPGGKLPPAFVYSQGLMLESVRQGRYKYVWRPPGFDLIGRMATKPDRRVPEELYDLLRDPQERKNIIHKKVQIAARMRQVALKVKDSRVANRLVCNWPVGVGELSGEIVTEGVFFKVPVLPSGTGQLSSDGHRFRFRVSRSKKPFNLSFELHPDFAPVQFCLRMDGRLVPASAIYLGKAGLSALSRSCQLRSFGDFRLTASKGVPLPLLRNEPGVYFYREQKRLSIRYSGNTTHLSTEIKTVLRDWGYIQR